MRIVLKKTTHFLIHAHSDQIYKTTMNKKWSNNRKAKLNSKVYYVLTGPWSLSVTKQTAAEFF